MPPTVAFHHVLFPWPSDAVSRIPTSPEAEHRDEVRRATSRLESSVGHGLDFYWTLTLAASEISGGRRAVVELGDSGGGVHRARDPDERTSGDTHQEHRPPRYEFLPPELRVSLRVDTKSSSHGTDQSALEAFVGCAHSLLLREQFHRAARYTQAKMRAFESQALHDLRALLHPLVLHASELSHAGSPSAEDLDLLDDLTRSLVEWVEEDLQIDTLVGEGLQAAASRKEATDLRAALQEAYSRGDGRTLTVSVSEQLPELSINRPWLEAGLGELLRSARRAQGTLEARRSEDGFVRIRVDLEDEPEPMRSSTTSMPWKTEYPPVIGGLLNLTAWLDGTLRLEAGSGAVRRIDLRLPGAGGSE